MEASGKTVGHSFKIFDPGKNGFQLTRDSTSKLKERACFGRSVRQFFVKISLQDSDVGEGYRGVFARNVPGTGHERER